MDNYKTSKEAFVSNMTGSSIGHINLVSSAALASIGLYSAFQSRFSPHISNHPLASCLILVLPLLLSMTFFADSPVTLALLILLPTGFLLLKPRRDSSVVLPNSTPQQESETTAKIEPFPAVTTYRAHMMLMTILAILAVDFPVFPRKLAKCETFGVSLMDIGVGSFVFSQGIVSAIPILKDPTYLTLPMWKKLPVVIRKTSPIILLGVIRVILVKGVEYPEHETEYGAHWNFFITLALLPILQVLLHPLILRLPVSLIGILVGIAHQFSLSWFGLENYVLHVPRTSIISANKEGIASLIGYLAIQLLGLSTGTIVLPPSPNHFRRQQQALSDRSSKRRDSTASPSITQRQNDKTATVLFSYGVLWWSFLGITKLLAVGTNVSRRMANLQYVLWVAAYNTSFILGYILLDLYFFPSPLSKSVYSPTSKLKVSVQSPAFPASNASQARQLGNPPPLLEAINRNGLALFLLANVATGLINMSVQTMYMSDLWAFCILVTYSFGISLIAWALRSRRLVKL
ncbi:hypothetical protein PLEOSDRAFT_1073093 [Pleurotus ostreatus PC15]|uniref:GPI-anchored wall transfer protein n=1 Tax=Pleurotus ostreatus (strain PC15) TaxID=1137138 RepID=A0A067NXE5_PLEO1|nr:hypothetical protein PLEOSDRAFT_1073093 [Pleurotus ostreatus PC15]